MRFLIAEEAIAEVGSEVYLIGTNGKVLTVPPSLKYEPLRVKIMSIASGGRIQVRTLDSKFEANKDPEDLFDSPDRAWLRISAMYRNLRGEFMEAATYFDQMADNADNQIIPF